MAELSQGERATESVCLISSTRWQKIQNLFAKVIGVNIALLDADGHCLTHAHSIAPDINDIVVPLDGSIFKNPPEFIIKAIQGGHLTGKNQLSRFGLHYFLLEIPFDKHKRGFFAIGPVLVGKKESDERILEMCTEEKIHAEIYLDQIDELKRYSFVGVSAILEFLSEIMGWSLDLLESEEERRSDENLWGNNRGIESLLSLRYGHELSNSLLEIALSLVEGDSGSVLLHDPENDCFEIQAARGLKGEIVRDTLIPAKNSISGIVAQRGKPMLIHKEMPDEDIRMRLQKASIRSSIVIPMFHHEKLLGLFCVNAEEENPSFNQENLVLMNQLGKIASIAFARINEA